MTLFILLCFAIPITSFAWSIVKSGKERDRLSNEALLSHTNYIENLKERQKMKERQQQMARSHQKQIDAKTWKQRNGVLVELARMEDRHLANTIKMVARNCHHKSYLGEITSDKSFIKLANECKRRKFQVTILDTPITVDGRREYVDVFIPKLFPTMKISASILLSDWDSRPQE